MCKNDCGCLISLVISSILGAIVGFIAFTTGIIGITTVIWIAFGLAVGALVLLAILSVVTSGKEQRCICNNGTCLAIGAIGTIIAAIIALAITITTGVIATAVLIGLGVLFLGLTLFGLLSLILCLVDAACMCRE